MAVEKIPTTVGIVASAVAATAIPETVLTVFLFATTVIIVSGAFTATCFVVSMIFLIKYFQKNKDSKYLLTTIFTQLIFSILILIFLRSLNSGSLLEFKPFWFTHSLIESYDKLFLPQIASLRANLAQNPFSYKLPVLIGIELSLFLLFIVGNLGFRVLSIFSIKKIKSQNNTEIHQFILIIILLGIIIPTFFVQKGTAWNTIQFFYYSLFLTCFIIAFFWIC